MGAEKQKRERVGVAGYNQATPSGVMTKGNTVFGVNGVLKTATLLYKASYR